MHRVNSPRTPRATHLKDLGGEGLRAALQHLVALPMHPGGILRPVEALGTEAASAEHTCSRDSGFAWAVNLKFEILHGGFDGDHAFCRMHVSYCAAPNSTLAAKQRLGNQKM